MQMSAKRASAKLLDFFLLVGKLKTTKRTGWVNHNVNLPESIADHMYRMSIMAMVVGGEHSKDHSLDTARLVKMALVHDLAESLVGDITPTEVSGVTKEDKHKLEFDAINKICGEMLDNSETALEILELWKDYESGESPEAVLAKDLDKFEMILQAHEYETSEDEKLDSFFESTAGKFKTESVRKLEEELHLRRNKTSND
eukprot:197785_1